MMSGLERLDKNNIPIILFKRKFSYSGHQSPLFTDGDGLDLG